MQRIWRRICMIHVHIQEPTQRDNFNINPSAVCLLCSETLHRIIQIFIDGSSAAALLAAFAFFFQVSIEPFFLPSFALKTLPVPSTILLLHPLETQTVKHILGSGALFSAAGTEAVPGSRAVFLCPVRGGGVCFAPCEACPLGTPKTDQMFKGSLHAKVSYCCTKCRVMIRRVLTFAFSCWTHTVSWRGSPTFRACYKAVSLLLDSEKKKKRGVFYQGSPKVPQVTLRFEICLESKALLIIPRALCLSSALWVWGVGI